MKNATKECVGFLIPVLLYASIEEVVNAGGRQPDGSIDPEKGEALLLNEVNANLYYRGAAPEARSVLADAIEAITQVPRETQPVMKEVTQKDPVTGAETKVKQQVMRDGKPAVEPVLDDTKYIKHAVASVIGTKRTAEDGTEFEITQAWLQGEVTRYFEDLKVEDGAQKGERYHIAVDITETPRKAPQPKKLSEKFLGYGKSAVEKGKVGDLLANYRTLSGRDYVKADGKPLSDADLANPVEIGWLAKAWTEEREKQAANAFFNA